MSRPEEGTGSLEAVVNRQTWVLGLSLGPLEELYALFLISVLKLSVILSPALLCFKCYHKLSLLNNRDSAFANGQSPPEVVRWSSWQPS